MQQASVEERLQQLRSKATELLLREDWKEYINLYSHLITVCRGHLLTGAGDGTIASLHKTLCLAHSNRAEARFRTRDLSGALADCDLALELDPAYIKSLICKAKVLLDLDRYSPAAECLELALACQPASDLARDLLNRCRKLESQARTGSLDISEWILRGFGEKCPHLAEYIGPVEIRRSINGGRGLFAAANLAVGTPIIVTRAVVIGRGILPESGDGQGEGARIVLWEDFVDKILDLAEKSTRTLYLIYQLSTGTEQGKGKVSDVALFKPGADDKLFVLGSNEPDVDRMLKILDVNCLTEEMFSTKVRENQSSYVGVGLWLLPSFVNHSCSPNARRQHIGDWMVVHAARDVKAGEEITFAYFDVLSPLDDRRKAAKRWGFECRCERCDFEKAACFREEIRELAMAVRSGADMGGATVRLEESMRRWMVKGKEKGFLRASIWPAFACVYESERLMRKWGRRIPAATALAESVAMVVGGDERILKVFLGSMKNGDVVETDKAMRLGRATYGKIMKRAAVKALFQSLN